MLCVLCHLPEEAKLIHSDRTQNGGGLWGQWGGGGGATQQGWKCSVFGGTDVTQHMPLLQLK